MGAYLFHNLNCRGAKRDALGLLVLDRGSATIGWIAFASVGPPLSRGALALRSVGEIVGAVGRLSARRLTASRSSSRSTCGSRSARDPREAARSRSVSQAARRRRRRTSVATTPTNAPSATPPPPPAAVVRQPQPDFGNSVASPPSTNPPLPGPPSPLPAPAVLERAGGTGVRRDEADPGSRSQGSTCSRCTIRSGQIWLCGQTAPVHALMHVPPWQTSPAGHVTVAQSVGTHWPSCGPAVWHVCSCRARRATGIVGTHEPRSRRPCSRAAVAGPAHGSTQFPRRQT